MKGKLLDEHLTKDFKAKKERRNTVVKKGMTMIIMLGIFLPYRYFFREESLNGSTWLVDYYWQIPIQVMGAGILAILYNLTTSRTVGLLTGFFNFFGLLLFAFIGALLMFVSRSFLIPILLILLMLCAGSEELIQTNFVQDHFELDIAIALFDLPFVYKFVFFYIDNEPTS